MQLGVCPGRVCHGECQSLLSLIGLSSTQLSPGTEIFLVPPSLHPTYSQQTTWLPTSFRNKMAAVSCKLLPSHSPFPTPSSHLSLFQPQRYVSESGSVFSPLGLGYLTYILPLIIGGWLHRGKKILSMEPGLPGGNIVSYFLNVWLWACCLTALCFSFSFWKMGLIITLILECCEHAMR